MNNGYSGLNRNQLPAQHVQYSCNLRSCRFIPPRRSVKRIQRGLKYSQKAPSQRFYRSPRRLPSKLSKSSRRISPIYTAPGIIPAAKLKLTSYHPKTMDNAKQELDWTKQPIHISLMNIGGGDGYGSGNAASTSGTSRGLNRGGFATVCFWLVNFGSMLLFVYSEWKKNRDEKKSDKEDVVEKSDNGWNLDGVIAAIRDVVIPGIANVIPVPQVPVPSPNINNINISIPIPPQNTDEGKRITNTNSNQVTLPDSQKPAETTPTWEERMLLLSRLFPRPCYTGCDIQKDGKSEKNTTTKKVDVTEVKTVEKTTEAVIATQPPVKTEPPITTTQDVRPTPPPERKAEVTYDFLPLERVSLVGQPIDFLLEQDKGDLEKTVESGGSNKIKLPGKIEPGGEVGDRREPPKDIEVDFGPMFQRGVTNEQVKNKLVKPGIKINGIEYDLKNNEYDVEECIAQVTELSNPTRKRFFKGKGGGEKEISYQLGFSKWVMKRGFIDFKFKDPAKFNYHEIVRMGEISDEFEEVDDVIEITLAQYTQLYPSRSIDSLDARSIEIVIQNARRTFPDQSFKPVTTKKYTGEEAKERILAVSKTDSDINIFNKKDTKCIQKVVDISDGGDAKAP